MIDNPSDGLISNQVIRLQAHDLATGCFSKISPRHQDTSEGATSSLASAFSVVASGRRLIIDILIRFHF